MKPEPEWIDQEVERLSAAKMRDHNKAEGEKAAALAMKYAAKAARFFKDADCPRFSEQAQSAANLLSAVSK